MRARQCIEAEEYERNRQAARDQKPVSVGAILTNSGAQAGEAGLLLGRTMAWQDQEAQ